jgi:hypothetical protein
VLPAVLRAPWRLRTRPLHCALRWTQPSPGWSGGDAPHSFQCLSAGGVCAVRSEDVAPPVEALGGEVLPLRPPPTLPLGGWSPHVPALGSRIVPHHFVARLGVPPAKLAPAR